MKRSIPLSLLGLVAVLPVMAAVPVESVSESVVVDAKPEIVWSALKRYRQRSERKVISCKGKEAVVQETFEHLPVIGSAECVYKETERAPDRVDYELIKSDKLTAFEGSWQITSRSNGTSSTLELRARTATALRLPFSRNMTRQSTSKSVRAHLAAVKEIAETM